MTRRKFTPLQFGSCALWLDAQNSASLYTSTAETTQSTDGAAVGRWKDLSGNGRHCDQATAGSKPTLRTSGFNSRRAVEFDATDDWLDSPAFTINEPRTIVVVGYQNTAARYFLDGLTGDTMSVWFDTGTTVTFYDGAHHTASVADMTTPRVYIGSVSGASSVIRVDATETGYTSSGSTETTGVCIGAYGLHTLAFSDGRVGEVIMYTKALSATERGILQHWLKSKWGTA